MISFELQSTDTSRQMMAWFDHAFDEIHQCSEKTLLPTGDQSSCYNRVRLLNPKKTKQMKIIRIKNEWDEDTLQCKLSTMIRTAINETEWWVVIRVLFRSIAWIGMKTLLEAGALLAKRGIALQSWSKEGRHWLGSECEWNTCKQWDYYLKRLIGSICVANLLFCRRKAIGGYI